jgi:excisionase family DNA binding protein
VNDSIDADDLDAIELEVTAAIKKMVAGAEGYLPRLSAGGDGSHDDAAQSVTSSIRASKSFLTADELAEILKLTKQHIYKLAKAGRMPSHRIGGAVRFEPKATADWIDAKAMG